mgnify:CR=1 FL=1
MVPFKPPTPSNHWNKTRQKCVFFYQKIVFSAMWHFTFLPFLIFLFISVELFHFWKTFKAYNTVLSDKNRNGILEYVSFCDKYFCLFYFSLVKKNSNLILYWQKNGGKNVALLNPPQLQSLQNKSLKKKVLWDYLFFPAILYSIFQIYHPCPFPSPSRTTLISAWTWKG